MINLNEIPDWDDSDVFANTFYITEKKTIKEFADFLEALGFFL